MNIHGCFGVRLFITSHNPHKQDKETMYPKTTMNIHSYTYY